MALILKISDALILAVGTSLLDSFAQECAMLFSTYSASLRIGTLIFKVTRFVTIYAEKWHRADVNSPG